MRLDIIYIEGHHSRARILRGNLCVNTYTPFRKFLRARVLRADTSTLGCIMYLYTPQCRVFMYLYTPRYTPMQSIFVPLYTPMQSIYVPLYTPMHRHPWQHCTHTHTTHTHTHAHTHTHTQGRRSRATRAAVTRELCWLPRQPFSLHPQGHVPPQKKLFSK